MKTQLLEKAQELHISGIFFAKKRDTWDNAERDFAESITIGREINDKYIIAQVLHSRGNLFSKDRNRWKDAEGDFDESIKIGREINNKHHTAHVLHALGILLTKQSDRWQDAENAFNESIKLFEEIRNNLGLSMVYYNYSELLFNKKDYIKAKVNLQNALEYGPNSNFIQNIEAKIIEIEKLAVVKSNNIILTDFQYTQNNGKIGQWDINGLFLQHENMIIGINATGKTKLLKAITLFANCINENDTPDNGIFDVKFRDNVTNASYNYLMQIIDSKIVSETIEDESGKILVTRLNDIATIFSITDDSIQLSVDSKKLTINVIDDLSSYPFVKDLKNWAKGVRLYSFSSLKDEGILKGIEKVPVMIEELLKKNSTKYKDLFKADFSEIGYPINDIDIAYLFDTAGSKPSIVVHEQSLKIPTYHQEMSEGMRRALYLIILIEYILFEDTRCTLLIDDLGEGLDFNRSANIAKLLFKKIKNNKNIQLIITSNDKFLIRSIDIEYINILDREGGNVKAYNYYNSKDQFDDSILIGFDGFDLFTSKLYKEKQND